MKYFSILLLVAFVSCKPDRMPRGTIQGYAPVYATQQAANTITVETSRATTNAGKIYAYGNYLFQVEQDQGIHIIDNSNPQQSHKIGFLKIPTCSELAVKSNFLYTNNLNDLVVFDLSNISSPQLVKRIANAFPEITQSYPPFPEVYFECPDPSKGIVVGWEEKMLTEPKCRR